MSTSRTEPRRSRSPLKATKMRESCLHPKESEIEL